MAKNNKNAGNKSGGDDIFGALFGALLGDEEIPEEEVDKLFDDLQGLLGDIEEDDDDAETEDDEGDDDDDLEDLLKEFDID
jgi:hypothetical protein